MLSQKSYNPFFFLGGGGGGGEAGGEGDGAECGRGCVVISDLNLFEEMFV